MSSTARTIITSLAVAGAAAGISVAGATTASAQQYGSYSLTPGSGQCTASQYASYQVRGDTSATVDGAKMKLLRNGVVVWNTPSRVNTRLGGPAQLFRHVPRPRLLLPVRAEHRNPQHRRDPAVAHGRGVLRPAPPRRTVSRSAAPCVIRTPRHSMSRHRPWSFPLRGIPSAFSPCHSHSAALHPTSRLFDLPRTWT